MQSNRVVDLRKKKPAPSQSRQVVYPVAPGSRRQSSLRRKRRRSRIIIASIVFVTLCLCIYGIGRASYLPQLSVGTVSVQGAKAIPSSSIQSFVEGTLDNGSHAFFSHRNILLFRPSNVEKAVLQQFPRIESVNVFRESLFATNIIVSIKERDAFSLWCQSAQSCFLMDKNGFIFAQRTGQDMPAMTYVFSGGLSATSSPVGQTFEDGHVTGLASLMKFLGDAGFNPIEVAVENDRDFAVALREGFFLKASFGGDAEELAKNLKLVLSSDALKGKEKGLEYVDLRFGNRVYYKFKTDSGETMAQ